MKKTLLVFAVLATAHLISAAPAAGHPVGQPDRTALAMMQEPPPTPQPAPPAPPAPPSVGVYMVGGKGSYLGVGVADIDSDRAKELKLKDEHGVEISRVEEDSPAAKAGLQKGDVVLEYQGQRVEGTDQFQRMVRETPPGRQVKLQVSRNGSLQHITATLGDRKLRARRNASWPLDENFQRDMEKLQEEMTNLRIEVPDVPRGPMSWRTGTLGITAEGLNPQLAEFFGVKQGVLIREVNKESAAEKAGMRAGDVIVRVDQTSVSTPQQVTQAVRARQRARTSTFPVTVVRNKQEMVLNVTVDTSRSSLEWTMPPRAIVAPRPFLVHPPPMPVQPMPVPIVVPDECML